MQKPTEPIFVVDECVRRWVVEPRRSFSACPMLSAMKSLPAPSGSLAVLPWYMSGASAVNPSAANRSQTFLMWPTSPHHSWRTSTPGPLPAAGVARYPAVLLPFDANSTMLPAMRDLLMTARVREWSCAARAGRRQARPRDRNDLHRDDTPGVRLENRDRVPHDLKLLAGSRDPMQGGEHEPGHGLVVALGQIPVQRLVELVDIGAGGDPIASVGQPLGRCGG